MGDDHLDFFFCNVEGNSSEHERDKSIFNPLHIFPILWLLNEKPLLEDRPINVAPGRGHEHKEDEEVEVIDQETNPQENVGGIHGMPDHPIETVRFQLAERDQDAETAPEV